MLCLRDRLVSDASSRRPPGRLLSLLPSRWRVLEIDAAPVLSCGGPGDDVEREGCTCPIVEGSRA